MLDIDAADQHPPGIDFIQPADEAHQRRFARAAAADDADHLARLDREADVLQHGLVLVVGEADVLELDAAAGGERGARAEGRAGDTGTPYAPCLRFSLLPVSPRSSTGVSSRSKIRSIVAKKLLNQLVDSADRRQRGIEHGQIGQEGHQRAERHLAEEHVAAADVPHGQPAQGENEAHHGT